VKRAQRTAVTFRTEGLAANTQLSLTVAVRPAVLGLGLVVAGIGMLTAGAWVSVPFYPVPMTMQTLAVLLVGGLLGPRLGSASVAGYLALGLAGAPVFHSGLSGPAVLAGPTGGYLVGFLLAALLMGSVAARAGAPASGRTRSLRRLVALAVGALLAEVAIYAAGVPWLALVAGLDLGGAVAVGVVPFILGDLLKVAVAIGAVRGGRSALARWGALPF
jgi:biotin transport system substrate-specific component